jgi:hypothetical protein
MPCRPSSPNVPEGTYVLSLTAHDHAFEQVRSLPPPLPPHSPTHRTSSARQFRIDVPAATDGALPTVRPYIPGTPLSPPAPVALPYPLTLGARRRNDYFVPPQAFDALGMLQSPMVLMMLGVGVMAIATPYLMVRGTSRVLDRGGLTLCARAEKHGPGGAGGHPAAAGEAREPAVLVPERRHQVGVSGMLGACRACPLANISFHQTLSAIGRERGACGSGGGGSRWRSEEQGVKGEEAVVYGWLEARM